MKNKVFLFSVLAFFLFFVVSAVENPIDSLMEKQGILQEEIRNVSSVDKNLLPSEISISSVDDSNVEIQQVEYEVDGVVKKMFILSFTSEGVSQVVEEGQVGNEMFLTFSGMNDLGSYVMLNSGSITGLSSHVDFSGAGDIVIELYVNDELMFISNEIVSSGDNFDFDLQSENIDMFFPGDVINLKVKHSDSISIEEVNSVVKVK